MRNRNQMRSRWLLSTVLGAGLLVTSGGAALAQDVPGENAAAATGPASAAATQTITLKPGQVAGTDTVLPADTAGNPAATVGDAHFVMRASSINQAEIMLGNLAVQRGQTQNERNFGQMLVQDHTQSNMELSHIASTLMLQTAPQPGPMEAALYQKLQAAPPDQFDAMFNHAMVRGHEHAIRLFEAEVQNGQSGALRTYAQESLPTLQRHLQVAQSLSPMAQPPGAMAAGQSPGGPGMAPLPAQSGMMVPPSPDVVHQQVGQIRAATSGPVAGNPDHSADQLNARVLSVTNQPS
ncbi:MAG TPA: DUF4142 domain-containing protein [Acidisoma sp.]|uniref:DUF4142 domain-containing protein n=1 Tax=Acidisoma sp. TaxID=1872115 RepID=UPI002B815ED4|nr:DUF4142 domain-containing protein [Acidisoma sp.]HTI03078.1 DUF4142 domain-containing protein [Acidisoma sp.]